MLQPSVSPNGALKYDMRVVAHDVEYYILMRDQLSFNFAPPNDEPSSGGQTPEITVNNSPSDISLRDSLWVFGGKDLFIWSDMQDVLRPTGRSVEGPKNLPIPTDFYPISILLNKGIVLGIEPEITQRRDVTFTLQRFAIRVSSYSNHEYQLLYTDVL